MVAFRFHIGTPDSIVPFEFASIDVTVTPGYGFYGFLVATIVSFILSHIMLAVHRHCQALDGQGSFSFSSPEELTALDKSDGKREALRVHAFTLAGHPVRCTRFGQALVTALLLLGSLLVWVGCVITTFSFEFEGAAGWVLGDSRTTGYSLFSVANAIGGGDNKTFGEQFIQISFVLFGAGTPIAALIVLLVLWVVPMSIKWQRGLFIASEVLSAWAGLEVFIVSIVAALLEISQFALFIIGGRCDAINEILSDYFKPGYWPVESTCFDVKANLESGCWVLFTASLIALFVGQLVTRAAERALDERAMPGYQRLHGQMPSPPCPGEHTAPPCWLRQLRKCNLLIIHSEFDQRAEDDTS